MIEIVYVYAVHNHVVVFYSPLSSVFVDVDWARAPLKNVTVEPCIEINVCS